MSRPSDAAGPADDDRAPVRPRRERRDGTIQSVERAVEMIEALAEGGGELSLSALAERTDLRAPTAHRILRTLMSVGWVRQSPSRNYRLGPALLGLNDASLKTVGTVTMPTLAALVRELGETANLAVLDADSVFYVAQVPSPHSMRMFTEVGRRLDAHNTGIGKAVLAELSAAQVRGIVDRQGLARATPATITTGAQLMTELELTRTRGYALDEGEREVGVRCVAVAVKGAPIPMGISVSGPDRRLDDDFVRRAVPLLLAGARTIARELSRDGDAEDDEASTAAPSDDSRAEEGQDR